MLTKAPLAREALGRTVVVEKVVAKRRLVLEETKLLELMAALEVLGWVRRKLTAWRRTVMAATAPRQGKMAEVQQEEMAGSQ